MASIFESLDEAALRGLGDEPPVPTHAIARRSASIFSRRGIETPEPQPPFIVQAVRQQPKQMTERQKSWLSKRRCPSKMPESTNGSSKPRGTVLNLVPKAPTINLTALEEEMATSPNQEILSAISSSPVSPTHPPRSLWDTNGIPLTQRTKSAKRRETNTRIGIWVNGVVQLDQDVLLNRRIGDEEPSLQSHTGFTPCTPAPSKPGRPLLSVIIPGKEPLVNVKSVSKLCRPMPAQPISLAPADIVSKYCLSSYEPGQQSCDISPIGSDSIQATPVLSPERPKAPLHTNDQLEAAPQLQDHERDSSSSSSRGLNRSSSIYSGKSSATSVEVVASVPKAETSTPKPPSPIAADINKPLPRPPFPPPSRVPPAPPSSPLDAKSFCSVRHERSVSTRSAPLSRRKLPPRPLTLVRGSRSLNERETDCERHVRPAAYTYCDPGSPTLSEAEQNLEEQLFDITRRSSRISETDACIEITDVESAVVRRNGSVRSVMHPPAQPPSVPRRSRRRDWRTSGETLRSDRPNTNSLSRRRSTGDLANTSATQRLNPMTLRRSASACQLHPTSWPQQDPHFASQPLESSTPSIIIDDGLIVINGPEAMYDEADEQALVAAATAQEVLLHILLSLSNIEDLFSTARINKGMYRVYKDNEMNLIRAVTWNQSPAAWELREWTQPNHFNDVDSSQASLQLEYTPESYTHCYRRDLSVIRGLKQLVLKYCSSSIRHETASALKLESTPDARRFEDALWRIWSFCQIFGCGKGREDDVTGQLDWLKGGILANNQDLTATMNVNLEFDMGGVLLNPPECFAQGNSGGLSAQQLYDMIELWSCLTTIMQSYHVGVSAVDAQDVLNGCEIDGQYTEDHVLEEWTAYVMTLGPAVILEMAECAGDWGENGFALAKERGLTRWSLSQYSSSRTTFLKEPLSRLYEERVSAAVNRLSRPRDHEAEETSRKRVANLAAEIKVARRASGYNRRPEIEICTERSMSTTSRYGSTAGFTSPSVRQSTGLSKTPSSAYTGSSPNFSVPRRSPPGASSRTITPIIEERIDALNITSLQNFAEGVAEDTSARAVKCIVNMGFSKAQAQEALKLTDIGDGLRVDRAVDLLLRRQQ